MMSILQISFLLTLIGGTVNADFLNVECRADHDMIVTYTGQARTVYASGKSATCTATEDEPAVFVIDMPRTKDCGVQKVGLSNAYHMDVVIQQGLIRQKSDVVYTVTCNYELGASETSGDNNVASKKIVKTPSFHTFNDREATSNITLELRNTKNETVTAANLGQYVQLVAHFQGANNESSMRVWNCRGYTAGVEYWILVSGCGEGYVLGEDKGFKTVDRTTYREARSSFFKAFALPGSSSVQFECYYLVCENGTVCDGMSCNAGARKRRAAPLLDAKSAIEPSVSEATLHQPGTAFNLPSSISPLITIIRLNGPIDTRASAGNNVSSGPAAATTRTSAALPIPLIAMIAVLSLTILLSVVTGAFICLRLFSMNKTRECRCPLSDGLPAKL